MIAGLLTERIMLQKPVEVQDSTGAMVTEWQDEKALWAQVTPIGGREGLRSNRAVAAKTSRFRIRFRRGITPKHRIVWESIVWNILYVDQVNAATDIFITAEVKEV